MPRETASRTGDVSSVFDSEFMSRLERISLIARRTSSAFLQGNTRSARLGASVEFGDFRRYSPGDDCRYVDWNAYARLDELFLKLFHEEGDICLFILVDASSSMGFGSPTKFVHAQRLAAALSYIALAGLNRASVILLRESGCEGLRPLKGRKQIFRIFEFLETKHPGGRTCLERALETFAEETTEMGRVVLISDLMDESDVVRGLRRVKHLGFEPQIVHLLSPQEVVPGVSAGLVLRDSETGEEVPSSDPDSYVSVRKSFVDSVDRRCSKAGIPYIQTDTNTGLEELLFERLAGTASAQRGRI